MRIVLIYLAKHTECFLFATNFYAACFLLTHGKLVPPGCHTLGKTLPHNAGPCLSACAAVTATSVLGYWGCLRRCGWWPCPRRPPPAWRCPCWPMGGRPASAWPRWGFAACPRRPTNGPPG